MYVVGLWRLRRRTGGWARRQVAAFATGWCALAVALLPPLEVLTTRSFAAHMGQHMLLGVVAPLLIVLSTPIRIAQWAVPAELEAITHGSRALLPQVRRSAPVVGLLAVAAHGVSFWVWHVPALYRAAAGNEVVHVVEHTTLFLTGAFFWWVAVGVRWRARSALGIGLVFLAALQGGAMAALITLAPRPLYASGPGALVDQQLGGGDHVGAWWRPVPARGVGAVGPLARSGSSPPSVRRRLRATTSYEELRPATTKSCARAQVDRRVPSQRATMTRALR